jgi:hypothetical protein
VKTLPDDYHTCLTIGLDSTKQCIVWLSHIGRCDRDLRQHNNVVSMAVYGKGQHPTVYGTFAVFVEARNCLDSFKSSLYRAFHQKSTCERLPYTMLLTSS